VLECDSHICAFYGVFLQASFKNLVSWLEIFLPRCRSFAKHWIPPLIQAILREDCGAAGIDAMVCDIVATCLSWNDVAIPEVESTPVVLLERVRFCWTALRTRQKCVFWHNCKFSRIFLWKHLKRGFVCGSSVHGKLSNLVSYTVLLQTYRILQNVEISAMRLLSLQLITDIEE